MSTLHASKMSQSNYPDDWEGWPDGSHALLDTLAQYIPHLSAEQVKPLAVALLGQPDLPASNPIATREDAVQVLDEETALITMLVQAWTDRVHAAILHLEAGTDLTQVLRAVRIIRSVTHYLPGGAYERR